MKKFTLFVLLFFCMHTVFYGEMVYSVNGFSSPFSRVEPVKKVQPVFRFTKFGKAGLTVVAETSDTISTFPYHEDFSVWPPTGWQIIKNEENRFLYWKQYDDDGIQCAAYSGSLPGVMISPEMNIASLHDPVLSFSWSHKLYGWGGPQVSANDSLTVEISGDGGKTWHILWQRKGKASASNDGARQFYPGRFVPSGDIPLSGYNTIKLRFTARSYNERFFLDNVTVGEKPTCPMPYMPSEQQVTDSSALLGWEQIGTPAKWEILWGKYNEDDDDTTSYSDTLVSTKPMLLTGLQPLTQYKWYVRSICGTGDTSRWTGGTAFNTAYKTIKNYPYTESFDNWPPVSWAVTFDFTGSPNEWETYSSGGIHCAFADLASWNVRERYPFIMILPFFDVSGLTHPELTFKWSHSLADGTDDSLSVEVSGDHGKTWHQVWYRAGKNFNSDNGNTYSSINFIKAHGIDLSSYGKILQIRFVAFSDDGADLYIDDVSVHEKPACVKQESLSVKRITTHSAILNWKDYGLADHFEISLDTAGFDTTGIQPTEVQNTPYTVTGLKPGTHYQWYVRSVCANGKTSPWAGPVSFTTRTLPEANFPYVESFDQWPPKGWVTDHHQTGGNYDWTGYNKNSLHCAMSRLEYYGGKFILVSPLLDVSKLSRPAFYFKWSHLGRKYEYEDSLSVEVSNDYGLTWHQVWEKSRGDFNSNDGADAFTPGTFVSMNDIDLSPFGDTLQVRFVVSNLEYSGANLFLDDFTVKQMSVSKIPTGLEASQLTDTSALLGWKENGTATRWQIMVRDTAQPDSPGRLLTADKNPFRVAGLKSHTVYSWSVRAIVQNDTSRWSNISYFKTSASMPWNEGFEHVTPGYSLPDGMRGSGDWRVDTVARDHNRIPHSGKGYLTTLLLDNAYNASQNKIITPGFYLQADSVYTFSFWYITDGKVENNTTLSVYGKKSDGNISWLYNDWFSPYGANGFNILGKIIKNPNDTVYKKFRATFIPAKSGKYYFLIYVSPPSEDPYCLTFDDLKVEEESCPSPDTLWASQRTSTSAVLNWTQRNNATHGEIMFDTAGFDTTGFSPLEVDSNHYKVTNLKPQTNYDWYVRVRCGKGKYSEWAGPAHFKTLCPPVDVPYYEDFEESEPPALPSCISVEDTVSKDKNGGSWRTTENIYGTNKYVMIDNVWHNEQQDMNGWLFTRGLNLKGGITYQITFSYNALSSSPTQNIEVFAGTGVSSVSMGDTALFVDKAYGGSLFWHIGYGNFTPRVTGVYYFGFHFYGPAEKAYVMLDNIQVAPQTDKALWTGKMDNDWRTAGNWSPPGLPGGSTDVTIPVGLKNYPTLHHFGYCHDLTIQGDSTGNGSLAGGDYLYPSDSVYVQCYFPARKDPWHGWKEIFSPVALQYISPEFVNLTTTPVGQGVEMFRWSIELNRWISIKTKDGLYNVGDAVSNFNSLSHPFFEDMGYRIAYDSSQIKVFASHILNSGGGRTLTNYEHGPGWFLTGNPYTCALYWNRSGWELRNIDGTAKIWNERMASYEDIPSGTGIIPPMHAYMVYINGRNGNLGESVTDQVHLADIAGKNIPDTTLLFTAVDLDHHMAQQFVIRLAANATTDFDTLYDARFLPGFAPQFYAVMNQWHLSTYAVPQLTDNQTIPLVFIKNKGTHFQIRVRGLSRWLTHQNLYLKDLKENRTQLLNNDSVYNFTAADGDDTNRFVLQFAPVGVPAANAPASIRVYGTRGKVMVRAEKPLTGMVSLYAITGQLLRRISMKNQRSATIFLGRFKGMVVVSVAGRKSVTNKVIYVP